MATKLITSTSDLVPAGASGYVKSYAAFLSLLIATALPWIVDATWANYAALAIAILGVLAVYGLPNGVVPIKVTTPPANPAAIDPDAPNA